MPVAGVQCEARHRLASATLSGAFLTRSPEETSFAYLHNLLQMITIMMVSRGHIQDVAKSVAKSFESKWSKYEMVQPSSTEKSFSSW